MYPHLPVSVHTHTVVFAVGSNHSILLGGKYSYSLTSGFLKGDSVIESLFQVIYGEVLPGVGSKENKEGERMLSKIVGSVGHWLPSGAAPEPGWYHRVNPRSESSFCDTS